MQLPQVQIPNFVGTLGQVEAIQQSRLQALAARQALEESQRFNAALPELTPALMAGEGPAYDAAVARLGGMGARGLQVALPLMQQAREMRALRDWQGGGGQAPAAPAAPAGDPMQRIAAVESGGNDAARNPNSSAAGRFQIIDSTWRQYAPRLGLTDAQRMDPAAQEQVARAIQADARQAVGRDLSPGEAYGAHFLGIGGLRAFLGADRNADAQQVYAQAAGPQIAAQAFRANPGLLEPGMTVGQVLDALNRRMGAGGAPSAATPVSAPGAAPQPRQGIDPAELRRIEMGLASPNPMIQRAAQARLQMLQMQQRGEVAPLETVEGPDGRPILVPREQAVGRTPVRVPNTVVNNNPGENAFERERGKALAERVAGWEEAGSRASQTQTRLARIEELNRQFTTGALANATLTAGQLAQRLGIPDAVLSTLGISRDQVAAGEGLRSLSSQMLVGLIGSGGFPAQNFSNADREMLERSLPSILNSPEGNRVIISILRASVDRDRAVATAWRNWARQNGEGADSVRRFQQEVLPDITATDVLAPLLQDITPASDPTGGGRIQADPPAPVAARPRARNAEGRVIEWNGSAWVPVQ